MPGSSYNDLTIGAYIPGDSLVHRLDPRAKLVCFLVLVITVFLSSSGTIIGACLCASIFLGWMANLGVWMWSWVLKRFAWLLGLAGGLNLFFGGGAKNMTVYGITMPFSLDALTDALFFTTQLAAGIAFSVILTATTKPTDLVRGMGKLANPLKRLRLPVDEGLTAMLMALRFAPMLQEELHSILEAQKARGVDFGAGGLRTRAKILSSVFGPALIGTLRRGDQIAVAMAARGFRPGHTRSEFRPLLFLRRDLFAVIGTALFAITVIIMEMG
jgi:energy-coupling factor transport system permease protein